MLRVESIDTYYGKSHVLHGVTLEVKAGEIVSILGRNGVGKTTTLKSILGLVPAPRGRIVFEGREIRRLPAHEIGRLSIGYTPQGRGIFPKLSVRDNLRLGAPGHSPSEAVFERVFDYFPVLAQRLRQMGGTLSGGEQQMLAIGRALMRNPRLILMDEPSAGLSPIMVSKVSETIRAINAVGVSVLLVEQQIQSALELSDRVYLMDNGTMVYEEKATELGRKPEVLSQHLGVTM